MAQQFGVSRNDAIAVSLLIQTIQILPLTLLGIALAPEFIFKRSAKAAAEPGLDAEVKKVEKKIEEGPPPVIPPAEEKKIERNKDN
jgi:hypothetical protein